MADKTGNSVLYKKRLELQRQEQLLTLQRQELRMLELDEERLKVEDAMSKTKLAIAEIEKSLSVEGINFTKE